MNRDILYKYFAGELAEDECAKVRAWADSSAENRRRLIQERGRFDTLLLLSEPAEPARRKGAAWLWRAAAAVAIAVLSSVATFLLLPEQSPQMLSLSVPQGQRLDMQLTDGTHVVLNSGTTLRYPAAFGRRSRCVEIDGEGYFEVARNESAPFIVKTYCSELKVLGTTFDVEAYSAEGTFSTALLDGSVAITTDRGSVTLTPGNKAVLASDGALTVTGITDYDEYRWREGIICFSDQSIKNIMRKFEKHFGVTIMLADDPKFEQAYTGKFYISDGVDYAMRVLRKDIEFDVERNHDDHIITLK